MRQKQRPVAIGRADAAELAKAAAILSAQRRLSEIGGPSEVARLLWRASKLVRRAQALAKVPPQDMPSSTQPGEAVGSG